jgi:hypothetical protein
MEGRIGNRSEAKSLIAFSETKSLYFEALAIVLVKVKLVFLDVKSTKTPEKEGFVTLLVGWLLVQYYSVSTITYPVRTPCGCSLKGTFVRSTVPSIT